MGEQDDGDAECKVAAVEARVLEDGADAEIRGVRVVDRELGRVDQRPRCTLDEADQREDAGESNESRGERTRLPPWVRGVGEDDHERREGEDEEGKLDASFLDVA